MAHGEAGTQVKPGQLPSFAARLASAAAAAWASRRTREWRPPWWSARPCTSYRSCRFFICSLTCSPHLRRRLTLACQFTCRFAIVNYDGHNCDLDHKLALHDLDKRSRMPSAFVVRVLPALLRS